MRLKRMEIAGFKSFVDKSSIEFPPGVSAIVGPNGCGKSNIVDALKWAMGEQSVKQLRGKSMDDVIFAGTSGKPPLNMAEVSLTLENDNGNLAFHYYDDLIRQIEETAALLKGLKDADLGHTSELRKLDAAVEDIQSACAFEVGTGCDTVSFLIREADIHLDIVRQDKYNY